MNTDDGKRLMSRFQETGDASAAHQLYDLYRVSVWQFLFRLSRSEVDADDLSQKVWLRLMDVARRSAYHEKNSATFKTYLFTIARNIFIDERRAAGRRVGSATDVETDKLIDTDRKSVESEADEDMRNTEVYRAFRTLAREQREVLAMWLEGFTYDEIADVTAASRATVIGRKRYAIDNLRKLLDRPVD